MSQRDKLRRFWPFGSVNSATVRIFLLLGTLGVGTLPGHGQEKVPYPDLEMFLGASALTGNGTVAEGTPLGGQVSFLINTNQHWGIVADFGMSERTVAGVKYSDGQYLIGPQFSFHRERSTTFFHALAGVSNVGTMTEGAKVCYPTFPNGQSCTTEEFRRTHLPFTLGLGGGLDVNVGPVAFRIFQADYLPYRQDGQWGHRFRIGAGIVLRSKKK